MAAGQRPMVCEGACNPTVRELDELVRTERRRMREGPPVFSESLLARLRTLRHTPHAPVGERWQCERCSTSRR